MTDSNASGDLSAAPVKMTKPKNFRKRYVVNRRFQYYFIVLLFAISALIWSLNLVCFQMFFQKSLVASEAAGIDLVALHGLLEAIRQGAPQMIAISFVVTAAVCLLAGLFLSHHIAGPIYRTLKVIDQVSQGDTVATPVKLRTLDCFPELENALTELVKKVQKP